MNNNLFILVVFWGVWIMIPVLFDGILTFVYMITIALHRTAKKKCRPLLPEELPVVSVIIPAYNEADNIDECLYFLKKQNYPQKLFEVIVVDNGSTDETRDIVRRHITDSSFKGKITLLTRADKGKAHALNTGINSCKGEIIINIDCRSFLASNALYQMVKKFFHNPKLGAITGNIEIDWRMIHKRDQNGQLVLNSSGRPIPSELTRKEKFLAKSQFLEYLASFRLGRQFQDITSSIYTLSGAFSAFRRDCLLKSHLYHTRTVSEDTDLTMDLMEQDISIGFCADAKAYLKPVISFEKFYAQRVRWARGQIEVIGLHLDWYGDFSKNFGRAFWHSLLLLIDHTFGFPRLVWTFLLPLFFLFGYSMTLIGEAIFLMYAFYVFIDFINACFCFRVVDSRTKTKIKDTLQYTLVTPIFRLITFFFRFAAYLEVLKEPQAWTTPTNPVRSVKDYRDSISENHGRKLGFGSRIWQFIVGRPVYEEKIAELDSFGSGISLNGQGLNGMNGTKPNSLNGGKKVDEKIT